ncbi:MupA/Atu3671 family FMN-dependent luciferase-like monooxygenase [Dactylosporangium siamense]|uniref:Siderophore biosynthesis protein n=1 Tax=Dactylosporangium siamense TaxID=685454 RepID=A0A919PST0_9ACTN|nr:MupA/Atu3671 family FMN-dependent luciferase-like monooxygenase [Dactylosporangium siamense]GIG49067.1 siderophore biosynthesis protein [Dactylosporangium siamense]
MVKVSLSYFAAGTAGAANPYDVLLDTARLADEAGLEAVWIPERHFGDFGHCYPNPSVLGAAVAAVTRRIGIRAGSVVLPLHHPVRVAEEWAAVDQLSGGRVGVSFASGWHGRDFILSPHPHSERRRVMLEGIDTVRALWRGEERVFADASGNELAVTTRPRPVQPELPAWVTSGGSTGTFELAGTIGAGVLTHLVGQEPDDLRRNIAAYRAAHTAGPGHVTLMMHTYVLDGSARAAERAEAELARYLSASMRLDATDVAHPEAPTTYGAMSSADRSAVAALGVKRFLGAGLICTAEEIPERLAAAAALGVDEVACLIDFGFDHTSILKSLDDLLTVLA